MRLTSLFHRLATRLLRCSQRLIGASTVGVRALVINDKQQILLVKHTYCHGWYFPGGGVNKNETLEAAIIRELTEEAGVSVIQRPELFGAYFQIFMGVNDYPILYIVHHFTISPVKCAEIAEIGWFDLAKLPSDITPATKRRINEYFYQQQKTEYW